MCIRDRTQAALDLEVFKKIADTLGIRRRYVGEEPNSHTTCLYNPVSYTHLVSIESLKEKAYSLVGRPDDLEWEDKVVAVLEARDGTILDVVRKIKPLEL